MSLRWRIAAWYALLLLGVIVAVGIIFGVSFQRILYDNAKGRIDRTMQDIVRLAAPSGFLSNVNPEGNIESVLANSDQLDHWASTTTFVQLDNAQNQPIGHSTNLGSTILPPNAALTPKNNTAYREVGVSGSEYLIEDRRIDSSASQRYTVHVAENLDQLNETFARIKQTTILIIALAGVAVLGLSVLLASQATNPINQLTRAMREIGSEGLSRRLKWKKRNDEIGQLAETFDDMLARLEEAFARERQFISDASHELKTPLTSINANAQMLRRWGDADERIRNESLETIVNETSTLSGMINGMLTLAKADSDQALPKEPVPLASVADEAARGAEGRALDKGLHLRLHAEDRSSVVLGDPNLIRQLITNLIDNAIKFTEDGGVDVYVRRNGTQAIVEVHDTGPGIDADEIPYIFERFYRTDKSRNRAIPGTGLGLAIVRSIARVHGGSVEAERLPGRGACFRVCLPTVSGQDEGPSSNSHAPGTQAPLE